MKFIYKIFILFIIFFSSGCQTIENRSQDAIKKENEKLSKFLGKPESELKILMGEPNEINHNEQGYKFFIYSTKKYNISCERKFEIDKNEVVVGFTSEGCF